MKNKKPSDFSGTLYPCSLALLPAAMLSAGLSMPVQSQTMVLEEMIVTAQRRQENLQEVPLSVSAFSQTALERSGITGTKDLPAIVPSVQLVTSGPSNMFFIRGVGNNSAGTGEEGTNAFYVDGVFLPSLKQSAMKFNNIERVEVLKGPQGTLFGRNSSGGLVNIITHDPGDEFQAKISAGVGNYDTTTAQLYVAGPLTETLSADLALTSSDQGEGWGENRATGDDVGLGWDWGARTKWVWRPNETTKISFSGDYSKSSDNFALGYRLAPNSQGANLTFPPAGPIQPLDDPYDVNTPADPFSDLTFYGLNLTAEFDLGWATLTSITGSRKGENHSFFDVDMTLAPLVNIRIEDSEKSFQQELRLSSNSAGPFNWQAGLFYLDIEAELDPQTVTGLQNYRTYSTLDTTSRALFGEISYDFTEATTLTLGARYTEDELDMEGVEVDLFSGALRDSKEDSVTEREPTWRLALRHQLTEDINVYASYNRGYKSGTISMLALDIDAVEPQTIDAYEVGLKSDLLDRRLRLNLSAFQYDISDYQVRSASGTNPAPILLNAAEVEVQGLEVEFEALPTDNLRLFGSLSWLDSEFKEFPLAPLTSLNPNYPYGITTVIGDASGNETPLAADFSGTLGVAYTLALADAGNVDFSLLYNYNDGFYFEPDNRNKQPAYSVLNASVSYRPTDNLRLELWGRNLDNETYYHQKGATSIFGDVGITAAPRTYGIKVHYEL